MSHTAEIIDLASYRRGRQEALVARPIMAVLPMVPVLFLPWWFVPVVIVSGSA